MSYRASIDLWMALALVLLLLPLAPGCRGGSLWRPFGDGGLLGNNSTWQRDKRPKRALLDERNLDRVLWHDLSPTEVGTTFKVKTQWKVDRAKAEAEFEKGRELYAEALELWRQQGEQPGGSHRAKFREAAKHLRVAASAWPDSALEQDALFLLGESYFFADRYVQANRAYEQLVARYAGTRWMDQVQARRFTIAQYWMETSRRGSGWFFGINMVDAKRPSWDLAGEGRRIFHRIRLDDPTGKLADDATMALANAYLEASRFTEAADTYEDLRRTYPGSRHAFNAHMLEISALLKSYRGRSYNGEPLEKADQLMREMVRRFPGEVREHREFLTSQGNEIRTMLAERDMTMGNYYSRLGHNRSAIFYYESVASRYADTELAEDASERIAALTGKPPTPAQPASWLVNMFPEPQATRPLIASGDNESMLVR